VLGLRHAAELCRRVTARETTRSYDQEVEIDFAYVTTFVAHLA
jgi:hypothetical protein